MAFLYFHDYHGLAPHEAGLYASLYGLMNLFARSLGGLTSDWLKRLFGIRGRIWCLPVATRSAHIRCQPDQPLAS